MTKNSLIILYCIVDDFIHRFLETSAGKKNLALYYGKRGPKHRMPVAVMKLNYNLVYHRARSVAGMFRHFFYSISVFLLHSVKDANQWFLTNLADVAKLEFWPFTLWKKIEMQLIDILTETLWLCFFYADLWYKYLWLREEKPDSRLKQPMLKLFFYRRVWAAPTLACEPTVWGIERVSALPGIMQ